MSDLVPRIDLERFPPTRNSSLRAWDAADELALSDLLDNRHIDEFPSEGRCVIVNDAFGYLSVNLAELRPAVFSDSVTSFEAIKRNLIRNNRAPDDVSLVPSTGQLDGPIALVVIKIPKTLALLDEQLRRLRPHLSPDTVILGAGMVKHIHTSTLERFEQVLGPTTTSLAAKKARLVHCRFDSDLDPGPSPFPTSYTTEGGITAVNHAGVFSQAKLDVGTRLLLVHLPKISDGSDVVDLGCGNGLVGTIAAALFDGGAVTFTDSSFLAVAAARATWEANRPADVRGRFEATNVADGLPDDSADLVLNNPPFHDEQVLGDDVARRMFSESKRLLRVGGELRVIGNRHLGYHVKLKRLFGNCETVGSNKKFVVLSSRRA